MTVVVVVVAWAVVDTLILVALVPDYAAHSEAQPIPVATVDGPVAVVG